MNTVWQGPINTILQVVDEGIVAQDRSGALVYANDAAARLLGCASAEELLARGVAVLSDYELFDERRRPIPREKLPASIARTTGAANEMRVLWRRRGSNKDLWSLVKATALRDEQGAIVGAVVVFHEITESVRAEEESRMLADASGLLTDAADARTALEQISTIVTTRVADECIIELFDARAHVEPHLDEHALTVPLRVDARVVGAMHWSTHNGDGRAARALDARDFALALDVGQRIALALDRGARLNETQAALRAREELVASVSHDLKNPLAVLSLNAEVLRRRARDSRDHAIADDMSRAVNQMDEMIRSLLDLATLESGRMSLELEQVPADTLVREAIARLTPLARAREQELAMGDVCPDALTCSPGRILQVFSNVIGNAIKFSRPGGSISVTAARAGDAVRFEVRDDGEGIPESDLPHVFERFFRGRSTAAPGTGLGLAIAKRIVETHGGTIDIASPPGRGTHVRFTLPAAAQP